MMYSWEKKNVHFQIHRGAIGQSSVLTIIILIDCLVITQLGIVGFQLNLHITNYILGKVTVNPD